MIRWLALLAAAFLAACATSSKPGAEDMLPPRALAPGKVVALWVDTAACGSLADGGARDEFLGRCVAAGITHLAIETRDAAGVPTNPDFEAALRRGAADRGLRFGAVLPLFRGPAGPRQHQADPGGAPAATLLAAPWDPASREPDARAIGDLARRSDLDFVLLEGCAFAGPEADLSPDARRRFEAFAGITAKAWPRDVIGDGKDHDAVGPRGRGPLWQQWNYWRAMELRLFLLGARAEVARACAGRAPAPILAIVDAPYPAHQVGGLNWASPDTPFRGDITFLPRGYEGTAAGHLLDGVVLGCWRPGLVDRAGAEKQGYAWWASIEGALGLARRYGPRNAAWVALPVGGGEDWPAAVRAARGSADGVLLVAAGEFLAEPSCWERLSAALGR